MIQLDGNQLTLEDFRSIVTKRTPVSLSPAAREKVTKARAVVDQAVKSGEKIYSINTGFGILSKVTIEPDKLEELQLNIIRSHCVGVGEPLTEEESRAMLLLRTQVLAKGFAGVRPELIDLCIGMLNKGVHPVIPCEGSVGASGDLAPLAHLAAVMIGEGEAYIDGKRTSGGDALKKAGLKPVVLAPKEGLALINGTQQMAGMGALLLLKAEELADLADIICATSLEGTLGTPRAYAEWVHETRPFAGQKRSAEILRRSMENSEIYKSHLKCDRVQDAYSFRCAPQVHGACRDLFSFVRQTLTVELNAATDNPLVNAETGEVTSQGNFHGQPVAFALDILAMGLSELASISERRMAKLMNPAFSELPAFLVKNEGLNSGFMIAQYTCAALVSENKIFAHPASVDSIPTNNDKEDHVSMGPIGARKAKKVLENAQRVLAIEALAACQALDFRRPLKGGKGPEFLHSVIRKIVPALEKDRYMHKDMEHVATLIRTGELWKEAKGASLV